ncbi:TB2/DP1/HVA22-related protein, partial [Kipferlia bialata]
DGYFFFSKPLSAVCCYILPLYYSLQTVPTKKGNAKTRVIVTWMLMGLLSLIEALMPIGRVHFYYEAKIALCLWLVHPVSDGATLIYQAWIREWAAKYFNTATLDSTVGKYLGIGATALRKAVFTAFKTVTGHQLYTVEEAEEADWDKDLREKKQK